MADISLEQFMFVKISEAVQKKQEIDDLLDFSLANLLLSETCTAEIIIVKRELTKFAGGNKLRKLASLERGNRTAQTFTQQICETFE